MTANGDSLGKGELAGGGLVLGTLALATEIPLGWMGLLSGAVGAATAALCLRRSLSCEKHALWGWRLLGGSVLAQSVWAAAQTLRSAPWQQNEPAPAVSAGLDTLAGFGLILGTYLFALLWFDRRRSNVVNSRSLADSALVSLSLATAVLTVPHLRAACAQYGWNPWLPTLATALVAGGPILLLLLCQWELSRQQNRDLWGWLAGAAASSAVGHTLLASAAALAEAPVWLPRGSHLFELLALALVGFAAVEAEGETEPHPLQPPTTLISELALPLALTVAVPAHLLLVLLLERSTLSAPLLTSAYAVFIVWRLAASYQQQQHTVRTLRENLAYLRTLVDNINEAVVTEDLGGKVLFANREFYRLFGLRDKLGQALHGDAFVHPDDLEVRRVQLQQCIEGAWRESRFTYRGLRGDGAELELEASVTPVQSGGVLLGVQWVMEDISRRRLIEKSQRAMAQRLEFFVSEMPLGCIIWDREFAVQEWNESAQRILGWSHSEVLHRRYIDFLAPPEDRDAMEDLWQRLRRGKAVNHRQCENLTKHRGKIECEWFHTSLVDESGQVVAVASMMQDVTERKTLERQLLQSQKMEAVGTLAGGIAHDFNNLLTTILGHLSLSLMKLGPDHLASAGLKDAEAAAERAADLIQQMLRFSRKTVSSLKPVNANECIENVARLMAHSIGPKIRMELDLCPTLWHTEADSGQLEQVLMNLVVNARDAIAGHGTIRIGSANRSKGRQNVGSDGGPVKGEFVEISVGDDGCGMDSATQSRVFEPFFTTKEVGKGTGLGLAMVFAIVRNHRGWVEVSSAPREGSVFRIFLPRTEVPLEPEVVISQPALRAGVETILLADDEEAVRGLARQVLEGHGYPVLEACDGQEAVEVFQSRREQIALVILDLTMPRKSGWEAFEEIHQLDAELPVVMSSGYSLNGGPKEAQQKGVRAFLSKPYKAKDLLATVQEVLDGEYSFEQAT